MSYKVNTDGFFVIEVGNDKFRGYRPCFACWTEVFETRAAARSDMADYVNEENNAKRGSNEYVRRTDDSGHHDGFSYIVCNKEEAEEIMNSRYHREMHALPFWVTIEKDEPLG